MAKYIKRDKAIEEIDSWLDSVGSIIVGKGLSSYGELIDCIQDIPAADVKEVKHGKWISNGMRKPQCPLCLNYNIEESRFCPNCGARMDGEGE